MSHEHIKIYKKVPYNTGKSKYPDLEPYNKEWGPGEALDCSYNPAKRRKDMLGPNTAQRVFYIPKGYISENYDDEPYIVPFVSKGSREAVIVVSGGAYQDVSLDNEGYPTCEMLQSLGITAFALKYRVYPYKYPCAALDCRRALCYVKYHAEEFGIDPNKVSLVGFSAGGNLVSVTTYLFKDLPPIPDYIPDEVDRVDPSPATVAPIYPELNADKFLMSLQFGERVLVDDDYYKEVRDVQYIPQYVKENKTPVFMCCCIDDGVVSPNNLFEMSKACFDNNVLFELHMFSEGGHGFGASQEDFPPMFGIPARRMDGTKEWIRLYATWVRKTLSR